MAKRLLRMECTGCGHQQWQQPLDKMVCESCGSEWLEARYDFATFKRELVRGLPPPLEWEVLPGADHFWWGQEKPLAQRVAAFFTRAFPPR